MNMRTLCSLLRQQGPSHGFSAEVGEAVRPPPGTVSHYPFFLRSLSRGDQSLFLTDAGLNRPLRCRLAFHSTRISIIQLKGKEYKQQNFIRRASIMDSLSLLTPYHRALLPSTSLFNSTEIRLET